MLLLVELDRPAHAARPLQSKIAKGNIHFMLCSSGMVKYHRPKNAAFDAILRFIFGYNEWTVS